MLKYDSTGRCTVCRLPGSGFVSEGVCECGDRPSPQYEHDCGGCQFLGNLDDMDVYQCDHIDLIIRFGSSPEENQSMPISIVRRYEKDSVLTRALELYDARYPHAAKRSR